MSLWNWSLYWAHSSAPGRCKKGTHNERKKYSDKKLSQRQFIYKHELNSDDSKFKHRLQLPASNHQILARFLQSKSKKLFGDSPKRSMGNAYLHFRDEKMLKYYYSEYPWFCVRRHKQFTVCCYTVCKDHYVTTCVLTKLGRQPTINLLKPKTYIKYHQL